MIGETPAPSRLGPVPEFGPNGESPPLRTKPVIVSWALLTFGGLFQTETSATLLTEQELLEGLRTEEKEVLERIALWQGLRSGTVSLSNYPIDHHRTKRAVYRQYWQRDDPIVQLVPGETQIYSVQLNSGVSDQVLREFSSSLGLGVKVSAVELSAQLSGRLSRTVTISTALQTTTTKQLTNTRDGYIRRVAIWHVVHSISLYGVAGGGVSDLAHIPYVIQGFVWEELQRIEFADTAAPQSTYFDVPVR